jgi:hypothetical protein
MCTLSRSYDAVVFKGGNSVVIKVCHLKDIDITYFTILANKKRQNRFMKERKGRKGMGDKDEEEIIFRWISTDVSTSDLINNNGPYIKTLK